MPARRVGPYLVAEHLAFGSMSELALALGPDGSNASGRVLVKLLLPHLAADAAHVEMFEHEAELGLALRHPNVVRTLGKGHEHGTHYLVLEYVPGTTVEALGSAGSSLPIDATLAIGIGALHALHATHELADDTGPLGVVHRDVCPKNLLVSRAGAVKLFDFGLATSRRLGPREPGATRGSLAYLAPEALRGGAVDRRADVFAMGIVLHELVSGRRLFARATEAATLLAVADAEIPRLGALVPDVPAVLESAVARALARNPDERFESAADFAKALGELDAALPERLAELVANRAAAPARRLGLESD